MYANDIKFSASAVEDGKQLVGNFYGVFDNDTQNAEYFRRQATSLCWSTQTGWTRSLRSVGGDWRESELDLIDSPISMWMGWIVAFGIASSMATWLVTSWLGSGKSIKGEMQELRTELRSEIQEVARGLDELRESVGDLRERVAKIEAFMEAVAWGQQGDLRESALPPSRQPSNETCPAGDR